MERPPDRPPGHAADGFTEPPGRRGPRAGGSPTGREGAPTSAGRRSREPLPGDAPASLMTPRQRQQVHAAWRGLQAEEAWNERLPVALLERCWLRLSLVSLAELPFRLPPDASAAAPELERYRELRRRGLGSWEAQQLCWEEFGTEACREAQRRFWSAQERGSRGWTLERYLGLRTDYRRRFRLERPRPLPLLVLAREGAEPAGLRREHRLLWLCPGADDPERPMRHTCA